MNIITNQRLAHWRVWLLLLIWPVLGLANPQYLLGEPPYHTNMRLKHDSDIYAMVGNRIIAVGKIHRDRWIEILSVNHQYAEFRFGNGVGFIKLENLTQVAPEEEVSEDDRQKPLSPPQNLLTSQRVTVYSAMTPESPPLARLAANLRYPLEGKQQDSLERTWYKIHLAGRPGYVLAQEVELDNGIPVLTYHHILQQAENKKFLETSTTTSDVAFTHQMDYLKQAGYTTISLYQLEGYLKGAINLPAKVVALTFDDGLKSVYRYAYPVLKRNGQRATAFIISSRIKHSPQAWDPDSLQFMSLTELRQIQDVFDLQSHTHFLHRLDNDKQPILFSRSYRTIELDFARSRRALAQFNTPIQYLSYPYGGFNQTAIKASQAAGYALAVTTLPGKVKLGDNPLALKRLYILRTDSLSYMAGLLENKTPLDAKLLDNPMRKFLVAQ